MIMTRETDYAVRILRALSCGERMTVRQVCDLELVPVQFAYKILKKLAACGYVEVFRGQEGGWPEYKREWLKPGALVISTMIFLLMPAWTPDTSARGGARTAACAISTAASRESRMRSKSC